MSGIPGGAFHSTKISGNSSSKWNGTEVFRKFVSKISVHLSRLSFFLEIWKFRKFPVPFGISIRFESAPVPLVMKSYKLAASLSSRHYTQNDLLQFEPVLDRKRKRLISWKIEDWSFRSSCGSVRPVCILSREKST